MSLLDDIEAFLETHEVSATAFGQQSLQDRHFVRQLRLGRRVWPETEAKVRRFMATYRPESFDLHAGTDTVPADAPSPGKTEAVSPQAERDAA